MMKVLIGAAFLVGAFVPQLEAQRKDPVKTPDSKQAAQKDAAAKGKKEADKKDAKPLTPQQQYTQLLKDHSQAMVAQRRAYTQAKKAQERSKILRNNPAKEFSAKFLELAQEHPETDTGLKAMVWLVRNGRANPLASRSAVRLIEKHHVASPGIGAVISSVGRSGANSDSLLRAVMEKNPSKNVKGLACFTLARSMMMRNRRAKADSPQLKEVLALMKRVQDEFGDIRYGRKTLGAYAESTVFELTRLQIGMDVPDIAGNDIDDAEFKLSEYRGKVVVLDFWGDW